jgi:hypothetical protein
MDSMKRPRAVWRTTKCVMISITMAITTGMGNIRKEPPPMAANPSLTKVMICPSVISCAKPRPATIRIRVATKG